MDYQSFLQSKAQNSDGNGFTPSFMPEAAFPFQSFLIDWSLRRGRSAIFADCGMGKTLMELAWAHNVYIHTGKPVIILTPLAVSTQTSLEGDKFNIDTSVSRNGKITSPIVITNYERISKFSPNDFGGIVCDESSILKSFEGETRIQVTEFMRTIPYRLLCTATAAPNDYTELGTSSEALGELGYVEMLNRFFINEKNTSDIRKKRSFYTGVGGHSSSGWRFKGHAGSMFWRWVAGWARAIRRPSDYGFSDEGYIIPEMLTNTHKVMAKSPAPGKLFDVPSVGLSEEREENKRTLVERCEKAAQLSSSHENSVSWCHLNDESSLLTRLIGAVEISGNDSIESKEEKLIAFSTGQIKKLVTKPVIGAWGLNWQHCSHMTYFPTHSYEQYYQSIRRCWRFGQKENVVVDLITTEGGVNTLRNLTTKASNADVMFDAIVHHMTSAITINRGTDYTRTIELPNWL